MATRKPGHRDPKPPSAARTLAIGVSLILSAMLTATALRNPALHWLAWISLLPLFATVRRLGCPIPSRGGGRNQLARRLRNSESRSAILRRRRAAGFSPRGLPNTSASQNCERSYRPFPIREIGALTIATIAGGLWGGALFLFAIASDTPVIPATPAAAALLITIPALYTGLAAALTRRIGFNPFVLAVGWIGVELALTPLGLPLGIMAVAGTQGDLVATGSQTSGIFLQWIAHLLGYAFIAFLVAAVNASLLAVLGGIRLSVPLRRLPSTVPQAVACRFSQTSVLFQAPALCPAQPRAPPQPVSSRQ